MFLFCQIGVLEQNRQQGKLTESKLSGGEDNERIRRLTTFVLNIRTHARADNGALSFIQNPNNRGERRVVSTTWSVLERLSFTYEG